MVRRLRLFEMGESRKCGANFPVVDVSAYSGQITACDALTTEAHAHAYDLRRSYAKAECGSGGGMQTDHHERVNAVETKRSGVVDISLKHGDM